jgi:hypothetical protein
MKKIKTIKDLRDNLLDELNLFYEKQTEDGIDRLDSISKTSSTIIRTAKVELEYAKHKDLNKDIDFLK